MKKIGILGSTGSVGSQTLEIIDEYKSQFELVFISGHSNVKKLNNQIDKYNPKYACISNDDILNQISDTIKCKKLYKGNRGLLDLCDIEVDLVVNAISGYKVLYLSVKLLENNINIRTKEDICEPCCDQKDWYWTCHLGYKSCKAMETIKVEDVVQEITKITGLNITN